MTSPFIPGKPNPKSSWQFLLAALMILLAIALTVQKIRSPDKDREKPPADAASGRTETPKPSRFRPTSGSELGSRERRKPRPTQAELLDDPSQIKELTPELAKLLLAKFKGYLLRLDGLTTLDADTAKALAEFKGDSLQLESLTTLDAATAQVLRENKVIAGVRQDIPITSKTRISKRPSKPKPMPTPVPVPPAANNQSPTFAWLGIIGAVVLLVCYRIWRKWSAAAKEQVNALKRKERTRRVPPN